MSVPVTSRFQIIQAPTAAPGNCFVCKTTVGPFATTGLRHDFWMEAPNPEHDGDVIICVACIREMATNFGLASADDQAKLADARRAGIVEGISLGKKALDEFAGDFVHTALSGALVIGAGNLLPLSDVEADAQPVAEDDPAAVEDSVSDDIFTSVEGRDDLSGTSGNGARRKS